MAQALHRKAWWGAPEMFGTVGLRLGSSGAGFAATLVVTAALGAAGAGFLFGTFIWASTIAIVSRWGGTDRILLDGPPRARAGRIGSLPPYVNRILAAAVARSVVISAVIAMAVAVARYAGYHPVLSIGFLLVLSPATVVLQLVSATTKALGRQNLAIALEFAAVPAAAILAWALDRAGVIRGGFWMYAGVYAIATLLCAALCFAIALARFWNTRTVPPLNPAQRRRTRDLALVELASVVNGGIGLLGLPLLLSAADVGIFNVVFRVAGVIQLATSTVPIILFPKLSVARRTSIRAQFDSALRDARLGMIGMAVAFVVGAFLAGPILLRAAGHEFTAGTTPLYILSGLFALGTLTGPNAEVLAVLGRQDVTRRIALSVSVIAIVLLVPATLMAGLNGAAWVTGLAFLVQKLVALLCERRALSALQWRT